MTSSSSYPTVTVTAGIPVVWTFKADNSVLNGCNNTLVIPQHNIQLRLKSGDNIIKFTPEKTGSEIYTCWMGMVYGQIKVVNADGSEQETQTSSDDDAGLTSDIPISQSSCCGAALPDGGSSTFEAGSVAGNASCCGTDTAVSDT